MFEIDDRNERQYKKIFSAFLLLIFLVPSIPTAFSHGSKEDCSNECNDYYCPPEVNKNKENGWHGSEKKMRFPIF